MIGLRLVLRLPERRQYETNFDINRREHNARRARHRPAGKGPAVYRDRPWRRPGRDIQLCAPLEKVFRFFKRELENHLRREEEVLFPLIRQLETASKYGAKLPRFPFGPLARIPSASWRRTTMPNGGRCKRCWYSQAITLVQPKPPMCFMPFLRGLMLWSRTCGSMSIWKTTSSFHAPALWRTRRGKDLPVPKRCWIDSNGFSPQPAAERAVDGATQCCCGIPAGLGGRRSSSVSRRRPLPERGPRLLGVSQCGGPGVSQRRHHGARPYQSLFQDGSGRLELSAGNALFPAMTPLFRYRPLTSNERRDLAALFESVDRQQPATPTLAIGENFAGRLLHPHRGNWSCGAAPSAIESGGRCSQGHEFARR